MSYFRWVGHLHPGCLLGKVIWPKTRWKDYMSQLSWEHLCTTLTKLEEVDGEKPVWTSLLRLLPLRLRPRYNEYLTHYIRNNSNKLHDIYPYLPVNHAHAQFTFFISQGFMNLHEIGVS